MKQLSWCNSCACWVKTSINSGVTVKQAFILKQTLTCVMPVVRIMTYVYQEHIEIRFFFFFFGHALYCVFSDYT